ncbi:MULTISPECIES: P-II family nitrogen regulator [unclassified Sphaerochaeta]|jgi:nitrogen regulatory protein PII|uniref:P-II family nitrogen regulator n=1 Tax=unclassified Sphaerochaeta TaxID=2637943 RepID=UPI0025D6122D|nr:P-II family nitrogen regulator [Sphaerochaeta sp. UBA5856]HPE94207.1 transcriptional regulator [Sphaerochaeta sp.]
MRNTLLFAIVEEGKSDALMQVAKKAGSTGGTILTGRGTASSSLLCILGLGDSHKEILMTMVSDAVKDAVFKAISNDRHVHGVLAAVPASWDGEASPAPKTAEWDLVNVICTSGYADDIMTAARKAGASGGTIVNGRGTAKADDIAFYGSTLVPEKELLMMFVKREQTEKILASIAQLSCMQKSGSGIAFTFAVQEFIKLGR